MPTSKGILAGLSLVGALLSVSCGGDSGTSAPPAPPPLQPLAWTDPPESATVKVREQRQISLTLSAAVSATYAHSASNANVALAGESPRAGIYRLQITGVEAGETTITVTATASGYHTATATFPLMVELRPLEWSVLPDQIEVQVGEEETAELRLNSPVIPELRLEPSNDNVAVSAECVVGACEMTVAGLAGGESTIVVTATADGYTEATGEIAVVVEDPFDPSLWRELVFDAYDCPNGTSDEFCLDTWGERDVEHRITAVLGFQPNFHLASIPGLWEFTASQESTIRDAIAASVEQVTGERFTGRITSGPYLKDQYGWVDIAAIGDDFWGGPGPCGAALVGKTEGFAVINVDSLEYCDLYPLAMHEVGHALGFFHVLDLGDYIMSPVLTKIPPVFSDAEQLHARLAWDLGRGAPYSPDPRKASSAALLTGNLRSGRGIRTLSNLPLAEMVKCPAH